MGSVAGKFAKLAETKGKLKARLELIGSPISDSLPFSSYPEKIPLSSSLLEDMYNEAGLGYMFWEDSYLATLARESYEITKDWVDYSTARDTRGVHFLPLFDTSMLTVFLGTFHSLSDLLVLPPIDMSNATQIINTFASCIKLHTTQLLDWSKVTYFSNGFNNCPNLTDVGGFKGLSITISFSQSPKLTKKSLDNIIYNLADATGKPSPTLYLHYAPRGLLTTEDIAYLTRAC